MRICWAGGKTGGGPRVGVLRVPSAPRQLGGRAAGDARAGVQRVPAHLRRPVRHHGSALCTLPSPIHQGLHHHTSEQQSSVSAAIYCVLSLACCT